MHSIGVRTKIGPSKNLNGEKYVNNISYLKYKHLERKPIIIERKKKWNSLEPKECLLQDILNHLKNTKDPFSHSSPG